MIAYEPTRNYKTCYVPMCTNTTIKTPEKWFVSVPRKEPERSKWLEVARRDVKKSHLSSKTTIYCCEDHFNKEEDFANFYYLQKFKPTHQVRIKLKENVLPSRFECQTPRLLTEKLKRKSVTVKLQRERIFQDLLESTTEENQAKPLGSCDRSSGHQEEIVNDGEGVEESEIDQAFVSSYVSIGVQTRPDMRDFASQALVHFRSTGIQVQPVTTDQLTSPAKLPLREQADEENVFKKNKIDVSFESDDSSPEEVTSSSVFTAVSW